MKTILIERRKSGIFTAVLSIVLGAVLFLDPVRSAEKMCMAVGFLLLAAGVFCLASYFKGTSLLSFFQLDLILGAVLCAVGGWMAFFPGSVVAAAQYVFGVIILVRGIIELQAALSIRRAGYSGAAAGIVPAVVTLVLGALILLDPFGSLALLLRVVGAVLIFDGAFDLYLILRLAKVDSRARAESGPIEADFVEAPDDFTEI